MANTFCSYSKLKKKETIEMDSVSVRVLMSNSVRLKSNDEARWNVVPRATTRKYSDCETTETFLSVYKFELASPTRE